MYDKAFDEGFGLTASNIVEPNITMGLVEGVGRMDSDPLLQISGGACRFASDDDAVAGLKVMGDYTKTIAGWHDIGVFLNVDHQTGLELIEQQIEFDTPPSIVIDASRESSDKNVAASREAVEMVETASLDVPIEAELGQIKGVKGEIEAGEAFYTDPEQVVEFVDKTDVDLPAIPVNTQHGVAKGKGLELRPDLVNDIRQTLCDHDFDTPLVLHGSLSIQPDQLQEMLEHGTCKVNKDTHHQCGYIRTACDRYNEEPDAIVPPEGTADARSTSLNETDWSPNEDTFDPRVVGRDIHERIADMHADLTEASGSAGQLLFK